jgi:ribonuclease HI
MKLSPAARDDLKEQSELLKGCKAPLFDSEPDIVIKTDASQKGWGVYAPYRNDSLYRFGGRWAPEYDDTHINTLETIAATVGLEFALADKTNQHVRLRADNTTAISAIKKQGDTRCTVRNYWAQRLWRFLQKRDLWLTVTHIPGVENIEADEESRYFRDAAEWGLKPHLVSEIFQRFGTPTIDMFATCRNTTLPRFASWGPDLNAEVIDCFTVNWGKYDSVYCFPPTPLVGRVIQKMKMDRARGILIVPHWESQIWFNQLRSITRAAITFQLSPDTVYLSVDDWRQNNNCPWGHVFRAVAVNCSGRP